MRRISSTILALHFFQLTKRGNDMEQEGEKQEEASFGAMQLENKRGARSRNRDKNLKLFFSHLNSLTPLGRSFS